MAIEPFASRAEMLGSGSCSSLSLRLSELTEDPQSVARNSRAAKLVVKGGAVVEEQSK